MSNKDHNTPTEKGKYSGESGNNDERNKRKLKEERNISVSKRMNSDVDDLNEPMIIRPVPLKYTKVSILPSHLKLTRKKKMTNKKVKP
jgi:hypothetical protein